MCIRDREYIVSADGEQPKVMYKIAEYIEHSCTDSPKSEINKLRVMPSCVADIAVCGQGFSCPFLTAM